MRTNTTIVSRTGAEQVQKKTNHNCNTLFLHFVLCSAHLAFFELHIRSKNTCKMYLLAFAFLFSFLLIRFSANRFTCRRFLLRKEAHTSTCSDGAGHATTWGMKWRAREAQQKKKIQKENSLYMFLLSGGTFLPQKWEFCPEWKMGCARLPARSMLV